MENRDNKMEKADNKKPFIKTSTIVRLLWCGFGTIVVTTITVFVLICTGEIGYMPPIEDLENPKDKFASEVYSSDGMVIGRFYQSQNNRVYVSYDEISPHMINALIATEDVRFTKHSGVDTKALFRSFVKRGLLFQKSAGGGSTITQQLAKLYYSPPAGSLVERLFQKPQEWVIATRLERYFTKEEIITKYLNKFDFLNNAVGIASAAQIYFHTTPDALTIEQAATLVGMCKNPAYYNPRRYNERTRGRRNVVFDQMCKAGYITQSERDSLKQLPLELNYVRADHKEGLAPYFREELRLMMMADEPIRSDYRGWEKQKFIDDSIAWAENPLYGWCNKNKKVDGSNYNIYTDGLKIYTTIDSRMQRYAEEAVQEHLVGYLQKAFQDVQVSRNGIFAGATKEEKEAILVRSMKQTERYRLMKQAGYSDSEIRKVFDAPVEMEVFTYAGRVDTVLTPMDSICHQKSFLRTGFMSMDSRTGHVKAYVGGPNFANFQYNMVSVGRRQVGSTIKPFLYTLAMEEGFTPCDSLLNAQPVLIVNGEEWKPRNSGDKRVGEMVSLQWALANSNNWISVRLMEKLKPQALANLLRSFGVRGYIDPVPSLCLGPVEVSVEEMVSAYTAFSNEGVRIAPLYVTRIEDNQGNVIAEFTPQRTQVMSKQAYYRMLPMLFSVVEPGGTGNRLRWKYNITAEMGAKTGTTNDNVDAWFMAFTPDLVSGVWVGGEERTVRFDAMKYGQGAAAALPIYALYINKVYNDEALGYSQESKFEIPEEYANPCDENSVFVDDSNIEVLPDGESTEGLLD